MDKNVKVLCIIGLVSVLLLGFTIDKVQAAPDSEERQKDFRNLLNSVDGLIRTVRLGGEITENRINVLENRYQQAFSTGGSVDVSDRIQEMSQATDEITLSQLKNLRQDIRELGELSPLYEYSLFVILAVSLGLAFTVNMISRVFVDWEEVNRVRQKQSELQDKVKEAKKENDSKRAHKLQKEQQEFMQEHMGTMFSPMKTMLIIIIPFFIVFNVLNGIYQGWVVAWVPFKFPWLDINFPLLNRFFDGPFVCFGFFGWYLFSYFGLSQLFRKILIPSQ